MYVTFIIYNVIVSSIKITNRALKYVKSRHKAKNYNLNHHNMLSYNFRFSKTDYRLVLPRLSISNIIICCHITLNSKSKSMFMLFVYVK